MKRTRRLAVVSVAVLAAAFLSATLAAPAPRLADVTGTWNLAVETQAGSGTPTVTLKQEGEALSGTYKGQLGEAPLKGTIKGKEIKFAFKVNVQGQDLEVEYSGTVEGDTMKGTVKLGELGEGTFTGKKK